VRVIRALIVVALLLPVSAACTSHTAAPTLPAASSPRSSAPSPSLIAPVDTLKASVDAAITAYRGLWAAYIAATRHPDPNDAGIRTYATADALHVFVSGLASMKSQGLAGKGTVDLHPKPVDIEPASAPTVVGISDCVNSAGSHLYKVDGSTYHDTKGGNRQVNATVQLRDGVWKVTEFGEQAVGSC
jgi:hypothetical protein